MPTRAPLYCTTPGCSNTKPCPVHGRRSRTQASPADVELWNSRAWRRLREQKLSRDPLCVDCEARGIVTAAAVVHHVVKRTTGGALLPSLDELLSLCRSCHGVRTRRGE